MQSVLQENSKKILEGDYIVEARVLLVACSCAHFADQPLLFRTMQFSKTNISGTHGCPKLD